MNLNPSHPICTLSTFSIVAVLPYVLQRRCPVLPSWIKFFHPLYPSPLLSPATPLPFFGSPPLPCQPLPLLRPTNLFWLFFFLTRTSFFFCPTGSPWGCPSKKKAVLTILCLSLPPRPQNIFFVSPQPHSSLSPFGFIYRKATTCFLALLGVSLAFAPWSRHISCTFYFF